MTPSRLSAPSALALFLALGALPALAQVQPRSLVLANRHLATVQEAYVSPVTDGDWGPDRLGAQVLAPGEDATVTLRGDCAADLRIVFANGAAEERRAVDICETTRIVLRPGWVVAETLDEDGPVAAPEPMAAALAGALRLVNAGPLPIVEVYAAPAGAPRGEDRLGADYLPVGAVMEVDATDEDACVVDLVAVFRDGREVARSGVNLCAGEEMEIR